jgi:hypothetical protein
VKNKRFILYFVFVLVFICAYENRNFYTFGDNITITIWKGRFGTSTYYLYPYKNFNIFRRDKECIKINTKNQFLELRFIDKKTLVICLSKVEYIDVKFFDYKVENIYVGDEGYLEFNNRFPCEKCQVCLSWAKIWEGPYYIRK